MGTPTSHSCISATPNRRTYPSITSHSRMSRYLRSNQHRHQTNNFVLFLVSDNFRMIQTLQIRFAIVKTGPKAPKLNHLNYRTKPNGTVNFKWHAFYLYFLPKAFSVCCSHILSLWLYRKLKDQLFIYLHFREMH